MSDENMKLGTPGPWAGKDVGMAGQDKAGLHLAFVIIFCENFRTERQAKAHLIVAAPEFPETLQYAEKTLFLRWIMFLEKSWQMNAVS